jgi:hypothetical protein
MDGADCPHPAGKEITVSFPFALTFPGCIPVTNALVKAVTYTETKSKVSCVQFYANVTK